MISLGALANMWPAGGGRCSCLSSGPTKATSGVLCPFLGSSVQGRQGATEEDPAEDPRMMRSLEHLSYEERLRELVRCSGAQ